MSQVQLIPGAIVASGDTAFQLSAKSDYTGEAHFREVIQPMFDEAAARNGVTIGALAVEVVQNDEGADLFKASAVAS